MNVISLILLLSYFAYCQGTIVLNLAPLNQPTSLKFDQKEITIPLTFCLRFNLQHKLLTTYMFSSKDDTLALTLRFPVGFGKVLINKNRLHFKIPNDNTIRPFHWHHICVGMNKLTYEVVFDGQIWSTGNHTMTQFETALLNQLDMGSSTANSAYPGGIPFKGELSELNIWSEYLSLDNIMNITKSCTQQPKPVPDILNWSSDIKESHNLGKHYQIEINQLCHYSVDEMSHFKLMPNYADQDGALRTCWVLGGILVSPKNIEEYNSWNGKKLDLVP